MENNKKLKGIGYYPDDEKIKTWLALHPKWRMMWLEEINQLVEKGFSPERRKLWNKFRRGEI